MPQSDMMMNPGRVHCSSCSHWGPMNPRLRSLIEQAVVSVEEPLPQNGGRNGRHQGRKVEESPEEGDSLDLAVQQKRQAK